jgi:hypothetical protein
MPADAASPFENQICSVPSWSCLCVHSNCLDFPSRFCSTAVPKEEASWFQVLCLRLSGRARREVEVSGQFDTEFERAKRSCADLASQMRCLHHFKNPTVEMDGENFDDFSIEVIACCEEFRKRVEDVLDELLTHRV